MDYCVQTGNVAPKARPTVVAPVPPVPTHRRRHAPRHSSGHVCGRILHTIRTYVSKKRGPQPFPPLYPSTLPPFHPPSCPFHIPLAVAAFLSLLMPLHPFPHAKDFLQRSQHLSHPCPCSRTWPAVEEPSSPVLHCIKRQTSPTITFAFESEAIHNTIFLFAPAVFAVLPTSSILP